jgi:thiol-disulfide isomerase/thioredoxin
MRLRLKGLLAISIGLALLSAIALPVAKVTADAWSCSFNTSPRVFYTGSSGTVNFEVTNTGDTSIRWIRIITPSTGYPIGSMSIPGWDYQDTGGGFAMVASITDEASAISPGATLSFSANMQIGGSEETPQSWYVEGAEGADGSSSFVCSPDGAISAEIANSGGPLATISNVTLSNLTTNSVTTAWDTDVPTKGKISYGRTNSYGTDTPTESSLTTSHRVVLTGLSSNTSYHFQIVSIMQDGRRVVSADNTFLTAMEQLQVTQAINVPVTNPSDKVAPTISWSSSPPHVSQQIPKMTGVAKDDQAVAAVQYSTDGGANWLPVDSITPSNKKHPDNKQVDFSFTPIGLEDGNYEILARAIDGGGNVATTNTLEVVIDRLPPTVGGDLISIGPQIMLPNAQAVIPALSGVDQKITLSAVGGPTSITLLANWNGDPKLAQSFALSKSPDTGLWSGIISTKLSGAYSLVAHAIDGAGNVTDRMLNTVYVFPKAKVVDQSSKQPVSGAKATLYYLESDSNSWVAWDGAAYGESNPARTGADGQFKLLAPVGKYYLRVSAKGYQSLTSQIFTLKEPTPIIGTLTLKKSMHIDVGSFTLALPSFNSKKISFDTSKAVIPANLRENSLIGKPAPSFTLASTNGDIVHTVDLSGRPTLITFVSTWSPPAKEQLPILADLQRNLDLNIEPIASQEHSEKVKVYTRLSGNGLDWLLDPDGTTVAPYGIQSLPTHYFIDRRGIVKQVVVGVLSKEELLKRLTSL